ncbi:hypothetical protein PSCLAVI8L_100172 [Pseudoclavibacter sp. 8L]|nr:hypothetical protein PSCLAVI8L_100172 [Pseudoclavibacter sp. 8L]
MRSNSPPEPGGNQCICFIRQASDPRVPSLETARGKPG